MKDPPLPELLLSGGKWPLAGLGGTTEGLGGGD